VVSAIAMLWLLVYDDTMEGIATKVMRIFIITVNWKFVWGGGFCWDLPPL
jgi:hypothetical protein